MKEGRPERLMTTLREYLSTPIEVPCGRGLIFRQVGERRPGRYVDARYLATTPSWPCATAALYQARPSPTTPWENCTSTASSR